MPGETAVGNARESITLFADGNITSISLEPTFRVYNAADELTPDYQSFNDYMAFHVRRHPFFYEIGFAPPFSEPVSLGVFFAVDDEGFPTAPFAVNIDSSSDFIEGSHGFYNYRLQHINEAQTFICGFSFPSLEATLSPNRPRWHW